MLQVKAHLSWRNTVIGLALLFLFLFVLMPLVVLVSKSVLGADGALTLENSLAVYSKSRNWDAVVMTLVVCGLAMLFSMAFAAGLAWLVVRSDLPGRRWFRSIFFMPYMIPPYVGAIAWILLTAGHLAQAEQGLQDARARAAHPGGYSGPNYAGGWAVNGGAASWWNQVLPVANNAVHYVLASGYLDWTANLSSADNQHALISTLNLMWIQQNAFSFWFGTGAFTGTRHVYGWAPSAGYSGGHADMPIYPHAGGLGVVGIGSDAPGTSTDNPGSGALIFGHELTHDYNVFHTNTPDACGSYDGNTDFPYANSSIQSFGINTLTGKIYNPSLTHDLMSYCPSGGSKQGWISPFTWNKMDLDLRTLAAAPAVKTLQPAAAAPLTFVTTAATQALVVNATLYNPANNPAVLGKLDTLQRVDAGVAYGLPFGTAYTVELRDGGDALLASEEFNMNFNSEYASTRSPIPPPPFPADPNTGSQVAFIMPWIDGTRTIRLLYNLGAAPVVIDTRSVPLGAPQVQFTAPLADATWLAHTLQPLTWTGTDLDGLPLVGPEGGFTTDELVLNGRRVALGRQLLRIETAALIERARDAERFQTGRVTVFAQDALGREMIVDGDAFFLGFLDLDRIGQHLRSIFDHEAAHFLRRAQTPRLARDIQRHGQIAARLSRLTQSSSGPRHIHRNIPAADDENPLT